MVSQTKARFDSRVAQAQPPAVAGADGDALAADEDVADADGAPCVAAPFPAPAGAGRSAGIMNQWIGMHTARCSRANTPQVPRQPSASCRVEVSGQKIVPASPPKSVIMVSARREEPPE